MDSRNPKDAMGLKKPQLGLMPAAGVIYGALAMTDGKNKYGAYNWRKKSVIMTIYLDAIERHVKCLRDGEWGDPTTPGVPHLGNIIACAAILADAHELSVLVDDRPPPGPASRIIAAYTRTVSPTATPRANGRAGHNGKTRSPSHSSVDIDWPLKSLAAAVKRAGKRAKR